MTTSTRGAEMNTENKNNDDQPGVEEILSPAERRTFQQGSNKRLRKVGHVEETKEAEWETGKVFFGWDLGNSRELERMIKRYKNVPDYGRNDAIRKALQQFKTTVQQRRPQDNREHWIDRSQSDLAFIAGERGSGKSFILRAMTDRSAKSGEKHLMVDMENEYYSSNHGKGIQKKLMMLRPNEERQNIDTMVLMPEFIYKARERRDMKDRGYDVMKRFMYDFNILDANDIQFLLVSKFGDHADFDSFANRLNEKIENEGIRSWSDIKDLAMGMQDESEFTYNRRGTQIKNYIENNYEAWDFLGNEPDKRINLKHVFNKYNKVALVLHDGGALNEALKMPELYVSFTIKKIRNLKDRNEIKGKLRVDLEESHTTIPANTKPNKPPSKKQIRRLIKQDRKRGLSLNYASQEPTDVQSKNFLSQTTHFFIPQNIRPRPRKLLLKEADQWRSGDRQRNKWEIIFEAMDEHQWLAINVDRGTWHIVQPASPLSKHRTE